MFKKITNIFKKPPCGKDAKASAETPLAPPLPAGRVKAASASAPVPAGRAKAASAASAPAAPLSRGEQEAADMQRALQQSLQEAEQERQQRRKALMEEKMSQPACANGCGWTAFGGHATCCRQCSGKEGPHAVDCPTKNTRTAQLCVRGCGRSAFASFDTCCTRCSGPDGAHTRDCAGKVCSGSPTTAAGSPEPASPAKPPTAGPSPAAAKATPKDVEESLRLRLAEWAAAGAMQTPEDVENVLQVLSESSGMDREELRVLWLSVARQTRPVGSPLDVYVGLAQKHHGVKVDVVDLGQYSAEHNNSCMFLSCAAAIADLRLQGRDDCWGLGALAQCLEEATDWSRVRNVDELIREHKAERTGPLGRMADLLRHSACEVLEAEQDFYLPFFYSLGGEADGASPFRSFRSGMYTGVDAYTRWVTKMRGDEEGDELVVLALARLLGIAIQPVQQSGYRVPLMDPTESASEVCAPVYWGNDDRHWVWLRLAADSPPPLLSMRCRPAPAACTDAAGEAPVGGDGALPVFGLDFEPVS
eukprot:TRINITY_DN32772_c0_g4_i1.p1 TRINITY_DN32772_c0_g4~~TRINITY_DN32772_c0_g4_i1.p1  ORF type:complete len:558 (+),score=84.45 TRINITY_DN32772_c0_g4_i1:80-1675(+)